MFGLFGNKNENKKPQACDLPFLCWQCEMSAPGGCGSHGESKGVCGKDATKSRLQDMMIYGLKGLSAYREHANELINDFGDEEAKKVLKEIDDVNAETLYFTLTNVNFNFDEHIAQLMKVGNAGVKVMDLLSDLHTKALGVPAPVEVTQNKAEGKGILVSGHNLDMLEKLLKRIEERGLSDKINVYTHSEMLPAHGYPHLRKFKNLKGNIGKAWYDQTDIFSKWNGTCVVNTNCIVPPEKSPKVKNYIDRLYTYKITGIEGAKKIENDNFDPLIDHTLELPDVTGFESDEKIATGHHYKTVLEAYGAKVLDAIKEGKLKRVWVIAGCDAPGRKRDYFRELALAVPKDHIIITSSCGKFRFNDVDFGTVPGTDIPRYIDLGQCNDSNGAVHIALAVANALGIEDINELPVSIALMWMEQKAIIILLALLSLGMKDIYIGPNAPQFANEDIVNFLVQNFNLGVISGDIHKDFGKELAS
ncbi:MAG: hydroxylamine reductase [Nautiliaceae bacterium]|jgi:hydroxylamine reductase